jgi:uncharacterized protein (DUF1697 family)
MADLRAGLEAAGFKRVRTHLQSGNVVLDGTGDIVAAIRAIIDVPVVVRTQADLEAAIAANPFTAEAAENPKALQVTFTDATPDLARLESLLSGAERVAVVGANVYSWHPDGMARSKLALAVTPAKAAATARNWNTVLKLEELARG